MAGPTLSTAAGEWREGWKAVAGGAMGMAMASVSTFMVGVFIEPIEREFGWSRTEISSGLTILAVVGVCLGPLVGMWVDRFGPRRIGLVGVILYACAIACLSLATPSVWSWWGLWFCIALIATLTKPTVWTAGVSSMFFVSRGFALSVLLCGAGIGSSLTPLMGNWLILAVGWRQAFIGLGLFWGALAIVPVFFLFTSAKDRQRTMHCEMSAPAILTGVGMREGLLSPAFAKLAMAAFLSTLCIISFSSNLVPILSSEGIARNQAAQIASSVGVATIVGRLSGGYLLDRINGRIVGCVGLMLPLLASSMLLANPGNTSTAFVAAIVLGLSLGVELDCVAYLATRHFGMLHFGTLFGTISGLLALGVGTGPLLVNWAYDAAGSYTGALIAYIPLCALASLLFLSLGAYPNFRHADLR